MTQNSLGQFHIQVMHSSEISEALKNEIIALCTRAYEEEMSSLFATFEDAAHVLGYCDGSLVCHALWITRYLQAGTHPIMRSAYVEAVATDAQFRKNGYAAAIMKHLVTIIQDFDLAALSPFSSEYYGRLGWELWHGPLFIRRDGLLLPSADDEEVMIYRLPMTPALDLNDSLSAEWREGELW